jgi:hypothetical protein
VLYVFYNVAATEISIPAGGTATGSTLSGSSPPERTASPQVTQYSLPVPASPGWRGRVRPGRSRLGCGETAESAAVATLAPGALRGSAFGLLATAGANLVASAVAGILWTAISPAAGFLFLTAAMIISIPLILASIR